MPETATAYFEMLVMGEAEDGSTVCHFACNICDRNVDDEPCPDHAPTDVPGLTLTECTAEPRHARVWTLAGDYYDAPCMYCVADDQAKKIAYHERCRHWGWRRTRLAHWAALKAYSLGIAGGGGAEYSGGEYGHHGCIIMPRWRGKRHYILGWPRWKWSCLLKQRHWPGEFVGLDSCSKCLPCPDCGATVGCHYGCDNQSQVSR